MHPDCKLSSLGHKATKVLCNEILLRLRYMFLVLIRLARTQKRKPAPESTHKAAQVKATHDTDHVAHCLSLVCTPSLAF